MDTLSKLHYVKVGLEGTFQPSGRERTLPEEIDAIFDHLRNAQSCQLTLHFHGGLNTEADGLATAARMQDHYEGCSHAITFIWETGFQETIQQRLRAIYDNSLFQKLLHAILPRARQRLRSEGSERGAAGGLSRQEIDEELARQGDFGRFDAEAETAAEHLDDARIDPMLPEWEAELEEEFEADSNLEALVREQAAQNDPAAQRLLGQGTAEGSRGFFSMLAIAKPAAMVTFRVVKRFLQKRAHGLYPTVMEELLREFYLGSIGTFVWDSMKKKAEAMWLPDEEGVSREDRRVGSYFLRGLADLQQQRPELVVDLVGHSAGAIVICHLLAAAAQRRPPLRVRKVVFLAPACSTDLFSREIVARPERYQLFRMFTMRDQEECNDRLLRGVYTRSLLYFISGVLEREPDATLAGLHRHTQGKKPYNNLHFLEVQRFLYSQGHDRVVLTPTPPDAGRGLGSLATAHGGFSTDPETLRSLRYLIEN